VFLSGITFAFIEALALGWSSPAVLTMALLGVIGLAVFLTWERHAASPMLPCRSSPSGSSRLSTPSRSSCTRR
jgi:hypothetical protein